MAKINLGVLGPFSGKVGTIVGCIWNGIAVIRGYNPNVQNPNTLAQQEQRSKFKLIVNFLRTLTAFLRVTFANQAVKSTAFSQAVSENLKVAIKGIFPSFEIDYPKVVLSKGNLPGALNPTAVSILPGKIDLSWENNAEEAGAAVTDTAMIVAYCPLLGKAVTVMTGATRQAGSQTVTVPDSWSGMQVQVYMNFRNLAEVSDSIFIDTVAVAQ